ncbi:MAG: sensor histidine kinase [Elainellaceae cyanobacterium]
MDWTALAWLGGGLVVGGAMGHLTRLSASDSSDGASRPGLADGEPADPAPAEADLPSRPDLSLRPDLSSRPNLSADPAEASWRLAYHLAAEMAQLKAGFLARTSHELRSPLNSVIGLHQLILTDLCDSPEEEREFVGQAHEAALKLLKLLDQMTDLSKLEQGNAALLLGEIDLNVLLLEVEQVVQIQAQNRNLRLTIEHPEAQIRLRGDRQRLLQVLIYLLTAPIYSMDSGYIQVGVSLHESQARIQIADQRPASAWSEPSDLLEQGRAKAQAPPEMPLQRDSSAGLTLMLCRQLLELMGGELALVQTPSENGAADGEAETTAWTRLECRLPRVT